MADDWIGIIPACAGNTTSPYAYVECSWDHPRVCGEHAVVRFRVNVPPGSSPRVRGTLVDGDFMQAEHGIIPACAGNTADCPMRLLFARDHPRVCGEHGLRRD